MPMEPVTEGNGRLLTVEKKHPKGPNLKGEVMIEGRVIKLSAWTRETPYGMLISLKHDTWQPPSQRGQEPARPREVPDNYDGEIPF